MRTPEYDVAALRNSIVRLRGEIGIFREIAEKSERENRWEQAEVFHRAVSKAEGEIEELEGYIRQIEGRRSGHTIRPG